MAYKELNKHLPTDLVRKVLEYTNHEDDEQKAVKIVNYIRLMYSLKRFFIKKSLFFCEPVIVTSLRTLEFHDLFKEVTMCRYDEVNKVAIYETRTYNSKYYRITNDKKRLYMSYRQEIAPDRDALDNIMINKKKAQKAQKAQKAKKLISFAKKNLKDLD